MNYLQSAIRQFEYYRSLGEKTFVQVSDETLLWQPGDDSNSIAMIVRHLTGNMLSRWTDFLTSDGEKEWRVRDAEFENYTPNRAEMIAIWNTGWDALFSTLNSLDENDLTKTIYIRKEGHTVLEAINRQLAHYPYHIGQIVYIGKMHTAGWESLSISKGNSRQFNESKFSGSK